MTYEITVCTCGCGCVTKHCNPCSGWCNRCQVGDCPHPDEKIPEPCPRCERSSNKAVVDEFGYCLRPGCKETPSKMEAEFNKARRAFDKGDLDEYGYYAAIDDINDRYPE